MSITRSELKDIQTLLTKKGRKQHRKFIAEGVRLLEEAMRHNRLPETLYTAPALLSERGQELVAAFGMRRVKTVELSARQMNSLSDANTSQGLTGVFETPSTQLGELYHESFRKLLLCDGLSDPGNLGTLIRSALAFGFDLVVLTGNCAEPYAPKVVRSSVGAVCGIPVAIAERSEAVSVMVSHQIRLVTADIRGETDTDRLKSIAARDRLALAVGSEADGVSQEIRSHTDLLLRIGHENGVESLNSAVAGSILMKEIYDLSRRT